MPDKTITTNVVGFKPKEKTHYVKIARNGERFWLRALPDGMSGTKYGKVDNHLIEAHPYKYGDVIEYKQDEVLDEQRT